MTDKYFSVRFTVEGSGRFPLDMLRYDRRRGRCCPEDQSDSGRMEAMRWVSFGWYVRSADGA